MVRSQEQTTTARRGSDFIAETSGPLPACRDPPDLFSGIVPQTKLPSSDRPELDLPPAFRLVALRELGDAMAHARDIASEAGAGTLVWVRRFDVAEFAVVLEPGEPLKTARRAMYAGMAALAEALVVQAPPERPLDFDWPDAVRIDGALVGGGALAWPKNCREEDEPDWLVFSAIVRTAMMRAGEAGFRPLLGSLDELGFEGAEPAAIVGDFARHLMALFNDWRDVGFERVARRWLTRFPRQAGRRAAIDDNGDLLVYSGAATRPSERRVLREALASASWRDPQTGMPWR
jgi:hypothetical protein